MPDNGAAVIVYGPHIGRHAGSEPGFMLRRLQSNISTSCGALWGVLSSQRQMKDKSLFNIDDIQLDTLELVLSGTRKNNILELTYSTFNVIEKQLHRIIEQSDYKNYAFPLFLLGGVIINTTAVNYFDVLTEQKIGKKGAPINTRFATEARSR
ncbi:MAG: hypothetical protein HC896_10080 [Bacteroidales bacterium]|nr:hypothetical protein [Bacteroidales bacterium]